MRSSTILIAFLFSALQSFSQAIPTVEETHTILKKEKQSFDFSLHQGYTLTARIQQMGIDVSISIYKKNDTARLAYFDSPNGSYGLEVVRFEAITGGDYTLVVEPLDDDPSASGKYSIFQKSIRIIQPTHDTSFSSGSGIVLSEPGSILIENLSNLGMIWGFLKYHHPAVAAGDFNWDATLFRILPKIIAAKTKKDANTELEKWVDAIGKPEACKACTLKPDSSVQIFPDYGRLFEKGNLSASLVKKLDYIKENRNPDDNYYISSFTGVGNPVFDHENPYRNMTYPDAGYRLLSLFRYWNIIQYFYPYKYVIGEDWNKILPEFIPVFLRAKNETQYMLACLQVIARIHDTHAGIYPLNALRAYFGNYAPPIRAGFVENKLVITGFYSDSFSIREKLHVGDIISKIKTQPVDELVKNTLYLVSASNLETQMRNMPYEILRSQNDSIQLEILRGDKKFTVFIHCVPSEKIGWFMELNLDPNDSSYKIIDGNIGYIFTGRYHNSQLPAIQKLFENTKGMIIDMRTYPGEFMPFSFGAYIKPSPSPFVKFTTGDINYPGVFRMSPPLSNGDTNSSYYNKPIVELVNSLSQSQAEYTTMAFQTAPDFTVIGSTTAGADGNVSTIPMVGGFSTFISGIGVFYPDGTQTQRKGIKIDMIVKPTIEGIRNGKDELLEKAIEIINVKARRE
ncbi:MAG: peptidase S41 [Bacteroidetes bacterium]|nr:peptidase S41 [Bacteroidota bacterium]